MKRITLVALALSLCSCQSGTQTTSSKDYAALAAANVAKYTIKNNDVYGFTPEGKFDRSLPILSSHRDGDWTVYELPAKKIGFDRSQITVDGADDIVRLQFFKTVHTSVGWRDAINSAYEDLKFKYKAVQRNGDADIIELTVYVARNEAEWKEHYIQYLQLMDEPDNMNLGAQNCWILQPHLSFIRATIKREGAGAAINMDFQTKKYAAARKNEQAQTQ